MRRANSDTTAGDRRDADGMVRCKHHVLAKCSRPEVAAAVRWRPGDRVLYPADEFPSNRYVWENLAERGVEPEAIELSPERTLLEALDSRDWDRVRLVALSAVSYHDGRIHDVAEVVRLQHPDWGRSGGVGVRFLDYRGDARRQIDAYVDSDAAVA